MQAKFSAKAKGEPEDQLRAPFEALLSTVGRELGHKVICKGETLLAGNDPPTFDVASDALTRLYDAWLALTHGPHSLLGQR